MNLVLFLTVLVGLLANGSGKPKTNKVVGGQDAKEGQFKYMVSLRMYNDHFCGGSIISEKYILTAAHCEVWGTVKGLTAVVGTTTQDDGGYHYQVKSFNIHEKWDSLNLLNDVAVIEVENPIIFNDLVQPIPLPTKNIPLTAKEPTVVSGWGLTTYPGESPNTLQWLELITCDQPTCRRIHLPNYLEDNQLCTMMDEGFGICSGDSGGPLVKDGELVGIASAAYLCARGMPDIFTRVYSFLDWIKTHTP